MTTKYVRGDGAHIAYRVVGDGPIDIVWFGSFASHVEMIWEEPAAARLFERLSRFARLIIFDKRGVGMSDPVASSEMPTLEQRMEDVGAVMEAAGSEQAVLVGTSEGGQLSIMFATTYPERVRALVLFSTYARVARADDYPAGVPPEVFEAFVATSEGLWGTDEMVRIIVPSIGHDPHLVEWWSSFIRRSTSPGAAITQLRMNFDADIRHLLSLVQAPTLVLHCRDEAFIPVAHGRYLADHIAGARLVELPGADHLPWGAHADAIADEIEEFVTGSRAPVPVDRALATVLFTDIVRSTERAAAVGDRAWRDLLDGHDRAIRRQLDRHRGNEVKTTGDGFLATFDGPARAIRCALAITEATRSLGIDVRAGVHTGEVELRGDDIGGLAVHIGARVAALAGPGEVLVSGAVPPLVVGSGIEFNGRGVVELKGVPGEWQLYAVGSG